MRPTSGPVTISFTKPISVKSYTIDDRKKLLEESRNIIVKEYENLRTEYNVLMKNKPTLQHK